MNEICLEKFKKICDKIIKNTPDEYKWQWDDRFDVPVISFEKKDMEKIFSTVIKEFMLQWNSKTIEKASKFIRNLVNSIFDIKPGQIIFTTDDNFSAILLAAWWPWNNGNSVSLRIGMYAVDKGSIIENEIKNSLKEWFLISSTVL